MSQVEHLDVLLHGEPAGSLQRQSDDAFLFTPRPQPSTLSLALRQDPAPRRGVGMLPAWFENLLPAREGRLRALLERQSGRRTSWGLLGWLGGDLPGAVQVRGEAKDDDPDEVSSPVRRASLGGMQLKVSLWASGDKLTLPLPGQHGNVIGKLASAAWAGLPRIEEHTMRWAASCGVDVPAVEVLPVEELPALAALAEGSAPEIYTIRRFDRTDAGRVHQEDLCQVFELAPHLLYGGDSRRRAPRATVRSVLSLIRRACGVDDAAQALRRLAFDLASGNTDAHLKNTALWYPDRVHPRLAPAYDLVCVIALPGMGWRTAPPQLALPLGGSTSLVDLDRARVDRLLTHADLPGLPAADLFYAALRDALHAWRDRADGAPAAMVQALREHHAAVPLLRWVAG